MVTSAIARATLPRNAVSQAAVADTLGRPVRDLRISVTDRCNFRCTYCMPKEMFGRNYEFLPHDQLLTFGCRRHSPTGNGSLHYEGSSKNNGWSQAGSNRRPPGCDPGALPAELWPLGRFQCSSGGFT